jgi:hypothetical protein
MPGYIPLCLNLKVFSSYLQLCKFPQDVSSSTGRPPGEPVLLVQKAQRFKSQGVISKVILIQCSVTQWHQNAGVWMMQALKYLERGLPHESLSTAQVISQSQGVTHASTVTLLMVPSKQIWLLMYVEWSKDYNECFLVTDRQPCAAHTCRMLCPHGFVLDDDGCPRCQCHDPCSEIECPSALSCELEDVTCFKQPCPPIPRCEYGLSPWSTKLLNVVIFAHLVKKYPPLMEPKG